MATDLLTVRNTAAGHSRFALGEEWFYPFDGTLTDQQAQAAFLADPVRESKVIKPKSAPESGKQWRIRGAAADDGATWWIVRGQAPAGQQGQILTYFDAIAGLTLESWLTNSSGTISKAPLVYSASGYASTGVINLNRSGGLPKYNALHNNIADGTYTVRVVNPVFGTVLRAETAVITATEPKKSLLSAPPAQASQSSIVSLTPSATRPAELLGIEYRGDGYECRFAFNYEGDVSALQWVLATAAGDVVDNSGPARTPNYQAGLTDYPMTPSTKSTARITGNTSLTAPIRPGVAYLLGIKLATASGTKDFVLLFTEPASPNAQVTALSLPDPDDEQDANNGASDGFVNFNMNVRRAGLFAYNNNRNQTNGGIPDHDADMIRWSVATSGYTPQTLSGKFNYFMSRMNWQQIENPDQSFDYRFLDTSLALADEIQKPLILCFDLIVQLNNNPDSYLLAEDAMHDQLGRPIEKDDCRLSSYSSAVTRARHARVLAAMYARIKASPHKKWVMAISVCNGLGTEHEYARQNRVGSNNDLEITSDYAPKEVEAFRTRAKGWYPSIGAANAAWGTSFANWEAVQAPVPAGNTGDNWIYGNRFLREWYNHRQLSMADYANMWHTQVKTALSAKVKTMIKFGSVYDAISIARGTATVIPHLLHDVISLDNDPNYNLAFSNAVAFGTRPANRYVGDEIFAVEAARYSQEVQVSWLKRTFAGGATIFDWAAHYIIGGGEFDEAKIQQARQWMKEVMDVVDAQYPIGAVVARPQPVATLNATTSAVLGRTWRNAGGGQEAYETQFSTLSTNGTQPVTVALTNDVTPT